MPRVKIQPAGIELEVLEGESVAEAAWRQGYIWPTQCWGQVDCVTCFTKIIDGELCALPAEEAELDAIRFRMSEKFRNNPLVRLGCQLRCKGNDLVLEKKGFRPAEPADNNMENSGAQPATGQGAGAPVESGRA